MTGKTSKGEGWEIICGDAVEELRRLPDASVDAVVSDPPYPMIRRSYGMLAEEAWTEMMHAVVRECRRILKPSGSAVFVLQPNSRKVGSMRAWLWEFMAWCCREWNMVQDAWWWNHAALPSGGIDRRIGLMRPSLKACVWLGSSDCYRNQDAVLWSETKASMATRAMQRFERKSPAGSRRVVKRRMGDTALARGGVTPFNVLPFANTDNQSSAGAHGHGAGTPLALCSWWTRYMCPPGGVILDPFFGSGTVGLAALNHGCSVIGIDKEADYCAIAEKRLREVAPRLPLGA